MNTKKTLILTKSVKDTYKNENIPHIRLAKRMEARNDLYKPRPGDRLPYLHIDHPKHELEHPEFIKEHNWRVHYAIYVKKQLKTPIDMIWGLIMDASLVYADIICDANGRVNKEKNIAGFLKLFHNRS